MYERMLNKKEKPTVEEMTSYCDGNGERFFPAEQVVIRNLENRTAGYISLWQSIRLGDGPQDWKEAHMQCFR